MLEYAKINIKFYKNSVPFNPIIVKDISTRADEYLPIISADGLIAFFTRRIHVASGKNDLIKGIKVKEIFSFSEKRNGQFEVGQPMPFPFNQTDNEGGATITIDNELLYYSVAKLENGYLNTDIYVSENIDGYWSEGEPINGDSVNLINTWDTQPTISSDGKTLYFVSDRPGCIGDKGDYDIYVTKKDENGVWCKPKNLGPTVNTKGREKSPFIHSDNKTLYFASEGWGSLGGYDIYYSRLDQEGERNEPKNIGYPINTADDETSFFVSTNGKFAFFASKKYNSTGGWDLFYFNLYEEARPDKVLLLKGKLKDKKTDEPVRARIELKNVNTKKIIEIPVDTFSGKYASVVSFEDDYIMTIKKRGYAYESRYIANVDSVIDEPINMDIEIKEIEVGESYKLNDIYFATNSYELTSESNVVIDGFIEFLEENYTVDVAIHGYTDNVGSSESNLILSENRAQAVYNYLLENGVNDDRLSYEGFGEEQPVASNENSAGRAKNRRTVFIVVNK